MAADRDRQIAKHFRLGDLLVDTTFPELAEQLDPDDEVLGNLERLTHLLDLICDRFPPGFKVLSAYRDATLNEACRKAGLPASVRSLHLAGCAADLEPKNEDIDLDAVFEWLRMSAADLVLHEAVFYPKKGFIHVAVVDPEQPTPRRILMRT